MKIKYFFKKDTPPFKVEEGCVITKAFYKGGVQYWQLHDIFNTFTQRAMDALALYEQWQMRCTKDFLIEHTKAVDAILRNQKSIDIIKIAELNSALKERLEWALPTEEIIWNFMAVAYFDENESPYKYDDKYGKEKIKRWKADYSIEDFFLSVPIKDIIPCPILSETDLEALMKTIQKIDSVHLNKVISTLSSSQQSKDSLTKSQ